MFLVSGADSDLMPSEVLAHASSCRMPIIHQSRTEHCVSFYDEMGLAAKHSL